MSSNLWTILLCFGCFFNIYLMSCLYIAAQSDEKKSRSDSSLKNLD